MSDSWQTPPDCIMLFENTKTDAAVSMVVEAGAWVLGGIVLLLPNPARLYVAL